MNRRAVLRAIAVTPVAAARLAAQQDPTTMAGEGYLPVRLPPKTGNRAELTALQRDEVERRISCPCPCTLDVFTCRTSMPCGFSPRMHTDVIALADNGYSADEILQAFVNVYGETARMAPPKRGFNLLAWVAPFAAIALGAVGITLWLRRSRDRVVGAAPAAPGVAASPDELARLEAAVRDDSR